MARHTTRLGLLTMMAGSVRTAMRPGSAGLAERAGAVPRMVRAMARGDYRGTTFGHVALLAAAVAYIVSPLDVMPEALFGVLGLGDDAVVVAWLAAALVNDTEAFLAWERASGRSAGPGTQDAYGSGPQDRSAEDYRDYREHPEYPEYPEYRQGGRRTVRSEVVG